MFFDAQISTHGPGSRHKHDSASCLDTGTYWARRKHAHAGSVSSACVGGAGTQPSPTQPCIACIGASQHGTCMCCPRRTHAPLGNALGAVALSGCSRTASRPQGAPGSHRTCFGNGGRSGGRPGSALWPTRNSLDGQAAASRSCKIAHIRCRDTRSISSSHRSFRPLPRIYP
jgi:hypothetical protein